MQSLSEIRAVLAERGLRPRRGLGQHFLHDKNQLVKLVEAARLRAGDLVLEVGPGTGTLTETLLDRGAEVVACEIDADLAAIIADRFGDRVRLVHGDCLARRRALSPRVTEMLAGRPFKLVANLPYQIASPLICTLLLDHPGCRGQFVTIQREVADRLLAPPGTKAYGALTIIVRVMADLERIAVLKRTSFWPPPAVDSAMMRIVPAPERAVNDPAGLARFVTGLFSMRRKQLQTILGRRDRWPAGVTGRLRPEALTVEQVVEVWKEEGTRNEGRGTRPERAES